MMNAKSKVEVRPGLVLKPILHPDELAVLENAAEADDHHLILPTHGIWRDHGPVVEPVGYVSFCVPWTHAWLHTKKMKARDSVALVRKLEQMGVDRGESMAVMSLAKESSFYQLMPKLGYTPFWETTLFAKPLPGQADRERRRD